MLAALLVAAGGAQAHRAPLAQRLDAALARAVERTHTPGATAAVVVHGRVVWTGAAGIARRGVPMRPGALVPIASCTKTVTATMVMKLALQGRIALDRPIAGVFPALPGAARITPHMLLNHSAGLEDYFADGVLERLTYIEPFRRWSRPEVLAHIRHLLFAPGTRHEYSNSGYVVLGGLLQHASGKSIESLFRQIVAKPLGLERSTFRYAGLPQRLFAHPLWFRHGRVHDYFGRRGKVHTDYWGGVWTDGGLATTAAGLARIGNALYAGRLMPRRAVRQMLPPHPGGWGFGTFGWPVGGTRWIGHDGDYGGYETENWTDRRRGVTVVVFTNLDGDRPAAVPVWRAVAAASASLR